MKKKIIVIGSVVILAAAGAVAALNMPETVNIDTAKRTDVEQSISITGNIIADSVETLYAPVSGRISDIAIKNGETIKENDIIATYDTTLIENEYEKASAAFFSSSSCFSSKVSFSSFVSSSFLTSPFPFCIGIELNY